MRIPHHVSKLLRIAVRELSFSPSLTNAVLQGRGSSVYWARDPTTRRNFGDAISPELAEFLVGKPAIHANDVLAIGPWSTLYLVGSILDNLSRPNAVVLGSGFKSATAGIGRRPRAVIAVRGPLTRRKLLALGVPCPEIYCDPGLLVPRLFPRPEPSDRVEIGLIPHFIDRPGFAARKIVDGGMSYRIVNIEQDPLLVIQSIVGCDVVVSSTLHGLITAHAYGIPAVWARFSDNVGGAGFKFRDYYASVGIPEPKAYEAAAILDLRAAVDMASCPDPASNVAALLEVAPRLSDFF